MKHLQKFFLLALFVVIGINVFNTKAHAAETTEQIPIKILFIGNSQTYYNDMPSMLEGLAKADNINCQVKSITGSSYKLSQFATTGNAYNTKILNALAADNYDYVVLQEHRVNIMKDLESTQNAISQLKEKIDQSGAKTILYATQGDHLGRDFTINGTSIYYDNNTLQYYMNKNYYSLSGVFDCDIAPVGLNYTRCMNEYPEITLYNEDMIHPSLEGSYLAACTLYQVILGQSAYNNQYLPGSEYDTENLLKSMDTENAVKLQNIADAILTLTKKSITLKKGTTSSIGSTLKYSQENSVMENYNNTINYASTNDEIIGVNSKTGMITGINTGSTMVMAHTDSGLMAFCNVEVIQPSTSLTITEGLLKLHRKDTQTYTTTIAPADTTDIITWTSSNPSVVSVDQNGTITAKKVGTSTITATTDSGIKLTRNVCVLLITPTNVKAVKASGKTKGPKYGNVKIKWKKNSNAEKYYIYRRKKGTKTYKKIATRKGKYKYYIDKNRKKGVTYYYKVRSVYSNSKCNSLKSKFTKITLKKK